MLVSSTNIFNQCFVFFWGTGKDRVLIRTTKINWICSFTRSVWFNDFMEEKKTVLYPNNKFWRASFRWENKLFKLKLLILKSNCHSFSMSSDARIKFTSWGNTIHWILGFLLHLLLVAGPTSTIDKNRLVILIFCAHTIEYHSSERMTAQVCTYSRRSS